MVGNFHYLVVGDFYYSVFFIVGTWAEAVDAAGQFRLSWKELVGLIVIIVMRMIKMIKMMEPGRPHDHEENKNNDDEADIDFTSQELPPGWSCP